MGAVDLFDKMWVLFVLEFDQGNGIGHLLDQQCSCKYVNVIDICSS